MIVFEYDFPWTDVLKSILLFQVGFKIAKLMYFIFRKEWEVAFKTGDDYKRV